MRTVVKYLVILTMSATTLSAFAQKEKVVEASCADKPSWIGTFDQSFITVTETGNSLSEVSEKALASIYQHIVNSIAVNISSSEMLITKSISCDNLTAVMHDYSSELMTEAANIPYINDISLTNAKGIYWEKIYSRKDKSYRYEYSVRYPFDEATRHKLVSDFIAIDNAKMEEMNALRQESETLTDLDRINRALNRLDMLHKYFFDVTRKGEVEALRRDFAALYSRLHIEVEHEESGKCIFTLRLAGRNVTTSIPARLKSSSALNMSVTSIDNNRYMLTYDPTYASTTDINTVEITYLFGAHRVSKIIYFNANNKKQR